MEISTTWVLRDVRYRWVHVAPKVLGSSQRISFSHRMHISLSSQSPSMPLCGKFPDGDYHPWPLLRTRAIASEDACRDCLGVLQQHAPNALGRAHRTLFVQGLIEDIAPPTLPQTLMQPLSHIASGLQEMIEAMHQLGLTPPEALGALFPQPRLPAPATEHLIEPLPHFDAFVQWRQAHPEGFIAGTSGTSLIVHTVACPHTKQQRQATYTPKFGTLRARAFVDEFKDGIHWCGECLQGRQPPDV